MSDIEHENENVNDDEKNETTENTESKHEEHVEQTEHEHDDFSDKLDSALNEMSTIKDLVRTVLDTISIKQNESHDGEIVFTGDDDVDLHDIDTDTPLRDMDFSM